MSTSAYEKNEKALLKIKQEEIREGIKKIAIDWFSSIGMAFQTMPNGRSFEGDIINYLHSQGVARKVELPELTVCEACEYYVPSSLSDVCQSPEPCIDCIEWKLKAGYVATEPLIKE